MNPLCAYCRIPSELASSSEIYGGRDYGEIWICRECGAYVGCHPGTEQPLGTLANKETRDARVAAHARFDLLWEGKLQRDGCSKGQARRAAYKWLAEQMGMDPKQCHISMFQPDQCRQVVALCTPPFINTL